MSYSPAVEEAATKWLVKHRATEDPRTLALIVERAQQLVEEFGGYISPSHFERAYLELANEGEIKPFRGTFEAKESGSPKDVVDFIERSSAYELQRRYKTDPTFRAHYDAYQKQSKQDQAGSVLDVETYRRMPAATVAAKYQRDPSFRAQVDSLISRGLI
jgi:hypothetical protein